LRDYSLDAGMLAGDEGYTGASLMSATAELVGNDLNRNTPALH
jgi:hypothetical protein